MSEESVKKPGWKSSEFWLAVVANLVSLVYMSGVVDATETDWDNKIVGLCAIVLVNLGYQVSRTLVKKA